MTRPVSRILITVEHSTYPFAERVRWEAETLTAAGYEVTVACPGEPGQARYEELNGVRVYRFPAVRQGVGALGYAWEYGYSTCMLLAYTLYLLVRRGVDIIQVVNLPDTMFVIGALAKLTGKKFVFDHHDLGPELFASKFGKQHGLGYQLLLWMEKANCRLADLVFAMNESYRRIEIERDGVQPHKTVIVRCGPRLEEFPPITPDPELRGKAPFIIGYVGRISSQDGVDYLLQSLHHLKYQLGRSDFFTVIIGPADNWEELQDLAARSNVQEHIWFTGKIPFGPDLLRYLSAADICVEPAPSNPLNDKSTRIKIMEYMALSKPIVAYDLPESRFSAGDAALYARPNDVADFAEQIAVLMDAPGLRQQMGSYGRARIESQLCWKYSAERLVDAYNRLALGARQDVRGARQKPFTD